VSNPLPSLLGLTSIADGSQQQAAPIRNNFSAIQTVANALITALKGGTTGALLYATDANDIAYLPDTPADKDTLVWSAALSRWVPAFPTGYEFDRDTNTVGTTVTATSVGTANVVIAGHAATYDGAAVYVDFSTYAMAKGTTYTRVGVYVDGAQVGEIIHFLHTTTGPASGRIRITPSAGTHTISIRAYVDAGTGSVFAGAGGAGNPAPNEMTVRKV
jgi:hypothetical protein